MIGDMVAEPLKTTGARLILAAILAVILGICFYLRALLKK